MYRNAINFARLKEELLKESDEVVLTATPLVLGQAAMQPLHDLPISLRGLLPAHQLARPPHRTEPEPRHRLHQGPLREVQPAEEERSARGAFLLLDGESREEREDAAAGGSH